mmetsp:Transcript_14019/g.16985  ORF Transcript_14019/g.16985 Transcript_14019/m.16985 type:complete len:512 (+) Transcript_14019:62-1597(+)|eukprot:CAMPEP_0197854596 /NCGR_PEP_ID=MMETSP1438-20131217/24956_1 /TAXON_ID=1461541 /ORGANISM="Pterosperma sp., Strain CCMP1384" /LENGTH=511 /DNA_ID=CAMNT_0043469383 /DNA_START=62 /DNA_END=1597 /DNA_ORIENTATION=+
MAADSYGNMYGLSKQANLEFVQASGGMGRSHAKTNVEAVRVVGMEEQKEEVVVEEELAPAKIKVLLMCTTFGESLAQDIVQAGDYSHLVTSQRGTAQHVTKGLLEVAGVPLVNYWMLAVKKCPRLLPVIQSVFIMANEQNVWEFEDWASDPARCEGFNPKNIISNGVKSGGKKRSILEDIDLFCQKEGTDANLVVIDCDYLFHPSFNLQRIIEHATIRGKDTVTYVNLKDESQLSNHVALELADDTTNPKVSSILCHPKPGETFSMDVLAPMYIFRRTTLPIIQDWVRSNPSVPMADAVPRFLEQLPSMAPVYALHSGHVFDVKSLSSFLYVDNLFDFYEKHMARMANAGKVSDTDSSLDWKTMFSGSDVNKRLAHEAFESTTIGGEARRQVVDKGALDLDSMLEEFNERYDSFLEAKLENKRASELPVRFTDASLISHKSKAQHPVYTTSSNEYGHKLPSQQEMPMKWHGIRGTFSSQFPMHNKKLHMYHNTGFVVSRTSSRVHKSMDDF